MAASSDKLGEVHELFAEVSAGYLKDLKAGKVEVNTQFLKTIKDFLKDNNIESPIVPGTPMESMAHDFPFESEFGESDSENTTPH